MNTRYEIKEAQWQRVRRYCSGFFILSVQVLVPSQGQELVPITEMDKNIVRLTIRCISNRLAYHLKPH